MDTYFSYIPYELLSLIFEYLRRDVDIINMGDIVKHLVYPSYFEDLFKMNFPLLYNGEKTDRFFLRDVINDDIYLRKTGMPWLILYALLYINDDIKKMKIKSYYIKIISPSSTIVRVLFKNHFEEIYNKLKKLESFDFSTFNGYFSNQTIPRAYDNYGLDWLPLLEIYFYLNGISGKYLIDEDFHFEMLKRFIFSLVYQERMEEILDVILEDKLMYDFFQDNMSITLRFNFILSDPEYKDIITYLKNKGIKVSFK